tara:strand:- start:563 stop:1045 length:483 start_codon:yes stop_codon:yes gene_type:complete
MRILGIDPGLTKTGFGILDVQNENLKVIDYGIIKPKVKDKLEKRLLTIFEDINEIIKEYSPTIICIEEVFYGKNFKSALLLGQARGAAMVSAASKNISIFEYSAKKIKQSVTGNGNAKKEQVRFMVTSILNMKNNDIGLDASDALAIAICHFQQFRENEL